ncbi:ribbon-helix-helix protein, CopG family [Pseudovibrio ascidiaceicola]|uniref:ribbon-helix-helix protein, CopG family n=1 Tax=Pseudovibrio ascidiaceicola TaxID=285279 RepID=UPI003D365200
MQDKTIKFRVTSHEKELLQRAAERRGKSASHILRRAIKSAAAQKDYGSDLRTNVVELRRSMNALLAKGDELTPQDIAATRQIVQQVLANFP